MNNRENSTINLSEEHLVYFAAERSIPALVIANTIERLERSSGRPLRPLAVSIVAALRDSGDSSWFNQLVPQKNYSDNELVRLLCVRDIPALAIAQMIALSEEENIATPRALALSGIGALMSQVSADELSIFGKSDEVPVSSIVPAVPETRKPPTGQINTTGTVLPPTKSVVNKAIAGNPKDNNDNAETGDSTKEEPATMGPMQSKYSNDVEAEMHFWHTSAEGRFGGGPMGFFRPGMVGPFSIEEFLCMDRPLRPLNANSRPNRIDPCHQWPQFVVLLLLALLMPMGNADCHSSNYNQNTGVIVISDSDSECDESDMH